MNGDIVARTDQSCEDAKQTARIIAAFYGKLDELGVKDDCLNALTTMYAHRILGIHPSVRPNGNPNGNTP